ncbi:AzlC family ABC transporter permease [Oenococcus oeni]|uniref:Branched-chain amino acid transporter AzlC n=1 Tax=Oenococcus oeni TaxID=1247 RepID=A0A6N4A1V2_OENOE|nr:AzlC family ABC transporter permease [Oenococcus oeni]MDV7686224.1 branched-chain amino acid ABC transporter permease [Oenococcus oeni]OIM21157.1 branched-chain amino acid transporter AzlC [Oenococcus oeni]OIM23252.1 branched-chain amino acid transporter AzlC [Oenococcus oeni]OIM23695.1 branched-chain amino acid transporter AzlC [Oenococcus oeni]SYW13397.1 Branched-chain amino acid transport protein [Oenococcus oeni]
MNSSLTYRSGVKDVLPTVFGYIGVGMAFRIVADANHLSILAVLFMSLLVYAASVQFLISAMLLAGSPVSTIVLSAFLINSRIILIGASIANHFKKSSLLQNIFIGSLLTDETFALAMTKVNKTDGRLTTAWFNAANIVAYFIWVISTVVGCALGKMIKDPLEFGLDFALIAMFVGLLYLQIINDHSKTIHLQLIVVIFVAIMMYFLMRWFSGNIALLMATIIGCLFGMEIRKK